MPNELGTSMSRLRAPLMNLCPGHHHTHHDLVVLVWALRKTSDLCSFNAHWLSATSANVLRPRAACTTSAHLP